MGVVSSLCLTQATFGRLESTEDRRGIIMHELGHVLRWDAAVNLLQLVAGGLFLK